MPGLHWSTGPQDTTLEDWQKQVFDQPQGIGFAGKQDKRLLKRIGAGDDVSSFGEFNTIRQEHAANRRDIGDSYLYGGNALIAGAGGEQANILNRMRDTAVAKDYEREGAETGTALSNLRGQAASGFQNAYDSASNRQLQQQQMALGSRLGYDEYRNKPYMSKSGWDKFMDIAGLAIGGVSAAKPGGF